MALSSPPATGRPFPEYLIALGVGAAVVGMLEQYNPRLALGLALVMLLGIGLLAHGSGGGNALSQLGELLQQAQQQLPGLSGFPKPGGTPGPNPTGTGGAPSPTGYYFPIQGFSGPVPGSHWDGGLAVDLMAPQGTPLLAVTGGVAQAAYYRDGGNTVTLTGSDGRTYYYAHLAQPGTSGRVQGGQQIGQVGNTGSAASGPPHLHFALSQGGFGITNAGTGNISPFDWLRSLLQGH